MNFIKRYMITEEEKKMENKYYTPTIEEFCVGFEYEELMDGKWWSPTFNFSKDTTLRTFERKLGFNLIRVKYLDREDIESLGFVLESSEIYNDNCVYKYQVNTSIYYMLYYRLSDEKPSIQIEEIYVYPRCNESLFKGFIKNKSELKRLFKQLYIEQI
jgi:hypothetical protein